MGRLDESRIEQFLREASNLANSSFEKDSARKKEILRNYFGRFQQGASQDLDTYDAVRVGAIFKRVYDSYRRRH